jgi:RNase H-fold protein (predicted Holliday junction resolvase)
MAKNLKNTPKVLGLDISTRTIGWALFDIQTQELLELTHVSPRPKIDKDDDDKLKELLLKSEIFSEKLKQYTNLGIVRIIIEEPLLNSNNVYTIQTLLRFNSFIFKDIYNIFGIAHDESNSNASGAQDKFNTQNGTHTKKRKMNQNQNKIICSKCIK